MAFIQSSYSDYLFVASEDMFVFSSFGKLEQGTVCEALENGKGFRDLETKTEFILDNKECKKMISDSFLSEIYGKIAEKELKSYIYALIIRHLLLRHINSFFLAGIMVLFIIHFYCEVNILSILVSGSAALLLLLRVAGVFIAEHILKQKRASIRERI